MQIIKWRCYEGILKNYFGILYFKNVLSFPSSLKPPGLTVLDMMVPNDMIQISTPAPCTGYTVKSLLCISSQEKLTVLWDGNYLFRALSKAISSAEDYHSQLWKYTRCLSQSMNLYYQLISKITSRILRSYIHGISAQKQLQQLPFYN